MGGHDVEASVYMPLYTYRCRPGGLHGVPMQLVFLSIICHSVESCLLKLYHASLPCRRVSTRPLEEMGL